MIELCVNRQHEYRNSLKKDFWALLHTLLQARINRQTPYKSVEGRMRKLVKDREDTVLAEKTESGTVQTDNAQTGKYRRFLAVLALDQASKLKGARRYSIVGLRAGGRRGRRR